MPFEVINNYSIERGRVGIPHLHNVRAMTLQGFPSNKILYTKRFFHFYDHVPIFPLALDHEIENP
jgi:hypothetical protein